MTPKHNQRLRRAATAICAVAAVTLLAGCTEDRDATRPPATKSTTTTTTTTAKQPITKPADLDGQVLRVTVPKGTNAFDKRTLTAQPGVVTIELRNPADRPLVLAIAHNEDELAEGQPAAKAQTSRITVPMEAGTYRYYAVGHEQEAGLSGTLTVQRP